MRRRGKVIEWIVRPECLLRSERAYAVVAQDRLRRAVELLVDESRWAHDARKDECGVQCRRVAERVDHFTNPRDERGSTLDEERHIGAERRGDITELCGCELKVEEFVESTQHGGRVAGPSTQPAADGDALFEAALDWEFATDARFKRGVRALYQVARDGPLDVTLAQGLTMPHAGEERETPRGEPLDVQVVEEVDGHHPTADRMHPCRVGTSDREREIELCGSLQEQRPRHGERIIGTRSRLKSMPSAARMLAVATTAVLVLAIGSRASAWGEEGHQIVGAMASARLTPEARAAVVALLGNDDLATAGLWADQIRGDPSYDWAKPYHYVNLPRTAQSVDLDRDCPTGECVVAAIPRFLAVACDASKPEKERREALKFAVHFIGDLHQPLHAGYKDDLGGNRMQIVAFPGSSEEKKTNLHALWDSVLIKHRTNGDWRTLAAELARDAPKDLIVVWESNLESADWANESAAITREIYKELPADQRIDQPYYDANIATVMRRLTAGGVRLAAALNRTFAGSVPAHAPSTVPST